MPKLYFRYGTMNSSKTANLLMTAHNYKTLGKKVIIIKPSIDHRSQNIHSRAIGEIDADIILNNETILNKIDPDVCCILVDEAQFLTEINVNNLRELSQIVPVICYGLRTDYRSKLFTGSKRLMEVADTIEEIKTVCTNCINKKAIINAKFTDNNGCKEIIYEGSSEPDFGREEKYTTLCWECWCKK